MGDLIKGLEQKRPRTTLGIMTLLMLALSIWLFAFDKKPSFLTIITESLFDRVRLDLLVLSILFLIAFLLKTAINATSSLTSVQMTLQDNTKAINNFADDLNQIIGKLQEYESTISNLDLSVAKVKSDSGDDKNAKTVINNYNYPVQKVRQ